jgi:PfaD family protein
MRLNIMAGAMAHGIASVELVASLAGAGLLGSLGTAGLTLTEIDKSIRALASRVPDGGFAVNLIHSFDNPELEQATLDLCLSHGIRRIEASAFSALAPTLAQFRAAGLARGADGGIESRHRLIVKLSRTEVAGPVMQPPPADMLRELVASGRITAEQAALAAELPVATEVTVEADSGGHTDNRQLATILPLVLEMRDRALAATGSFIFVGAGGGIGTPSAAAAAFAAGADYLVTGSINQACTEAATSKAVKQLLAQAESTDTAMVAAADMFELGAKVQVLRRGTLFPIRARRLEQLYHRYDSVEEVPADERAKLETQIFGCGLDRVWSDVQTFFGERDPGLLDRCAEDPKQRMALIFRWYLGQSSRWATAGIEARAADYQIWCGAAMGAFNAWTRGSPYAEPARRHVAEVAAGLMTGASYLLRLQSLKSAAVTLPGELLACRPQDVMGLPEGDPVPAAARSNGSGAREIRELLVAAVAEQAKIAPAQIDVRATFASFGLDSPAALVVLARIERRLGRRLSQTLVWNFPTIEALAERLAEDG